MPDKSWFVDTSAGEVDMVKKRRRTVDFEKEKEVEKEHGRKTRAKLGLKGDKISHYEFVASAIRRASTLTLRLRLPHPEIDILRQVMPQFTSMSKSKNLPTDSRPKQAKTRGRRKTFSTSGVYPRPLILLPPCLSENIKFGEP